MSCCTNPIWKYLVSLGAITEESVMAAFLPDISSPDSTLQLEAPVIGAIDTILVDATFLLAEPTVAGEKVTAVALSGGTIADVGDAKRIMKSAPKAKQISLNNTVLAPGFVEAHAHIVMAIQKLFMTDLGYSNYRTYEDVCAKICNDLAMAKNGNWLLYQNFDPSMLDWTPEGFHQLGFDVFEKIPNAENVNIFVLNASGHIAYANEKAFKTAKIVKDPPGGRYQQVDSKFTGVMFESPTYEPFLGPAIRSKVMKLVPNLRSALLGFLEEAQRVGITTIADPSVGVGTSLELELILYNFMACAQKRPTDVVGSLDCAKLYPQSKNASVAHPFQLQMPKAPGATGSYRGLIIPALKLWADGSTQGYTAYLTKPYLPPVTPHGLGECGTPDWTQDELNSFLRNAKKDDWSILIHANGDGAVTMALNAIESVYGANSGFRLRLEHCTVATSEQYDRMEKLGVTPTYLNNHIYLWGDTFNDHILGNERASRIDNASEAVKRDMLFSFHCDYPVSMPGPLRYMQTAVTRTTMRGTVLGKEYAISALDALKGVTIHPAKQLGIDDTIGTIKKGKYANFVNLATDPTTCPSDDIASTQILATYLRGRRIDIKAAS